MKNLVLIKKAGFEVEGMEFRFEQIQDIVNKMDNVKIGIKYVPVTDFAETKIVFMIKHMKKEDLSKLTYEDFVRMAGGDK